MKLFWQTFTSEQAKQKAMEQAEKHGVPFTAFPVRGGWNILPCLDKTVVPSTDGLDKVILVLQVGKPMDFMSIAEKSGLTIQQVVAVAKIICTGGSGSARESDVRLQKITTDVGRSGKVVGLHTTG